jgi:AraC-like DNA-binding protein
MQRGRVQMPRCAIDGVEATIAETAHAFPRHSHDVFGIGVMVRGGQRSASGRGPVEARIGDVITCNPGEVHDGSPLDERGRAWRMLYFAPALMFEAAGELMLANARAVELTRPVAHDPQLKSLFNRLFNAAVDEAAHIDDLAREEALLALLAYVGARHATLTPLRLAAAPIARAKARIDDDPSSSLTLSDLAREAGMSRFQLLRSFAQELGLPPHAYRMQRRVMLARQLIAAGCALADAAAGAGFADQSHMTRAFVRLLGVTPASYAAAMRRP